MRKIILVLLLSLPCVVWAQGVGVRLDGGVSYSLGGGLAGGSVNKRTAVQPQGGVGVYFSINPSFRAGLDYSYSRMVRSQVDGVLDQLPDGSVQGDVYSDLKTHFHGAAVSAEFNPLSVGPLSLYLGTGLGCLFGVGNTYTLGVSNMVKPDGTGNTIRVTGHNEGHRYVSPFIPLTLSLEYSFLPQVAVSLNGGYRIVFTLGNALSPKGQAYVQLGLRFNLSK